MVQSTKTAILKMLLDDDHDYVSGAFMSHQLQLTRAAIWKHISSLRMEGYAIESQKKRGYKLLDQPDALSSDALIAGLQTSYIGQRVRYEPSVASTQEIAHQLAAEEADEGYVVVADEQTSGRGRLGRVWHAPKEKNVSTSIILRPDIPPEQAPQMTLMAAVAVVRAIQSVTSLTCDIKWPNDILYQQKKIVGILTELNAEPDRIHSVILGIGMNINEQAQDFPQELLDIATSLRMASGQYQERLPILQAIYQEIETLYEAYLQKGFEFIKLLWESYALHLGEAVSAKSARGVLEGVTKGLTKEGFLILEDREGIRHYISSADIQFES